MSVKKLFAIWILFVSSVIAVYGFWGLYSKSDISYWNLLGTMLLLAFSCHLSGIYHYMTTKNKKSLTIVLYGSIVIIFAAGAFYLPELLDLRKWQIYARIPNQFFFSSFMLIFGILGGYLSFRPFYDFSKEGEQMGGYYLLYLSILFTILPLALIIFNIMTRGVSGITWEFLTQDIRSMGEEGGVFPAILGTLALIGLTGVIVIPLGVGTAIYLSEYAEEGIIVRIIRTAVNIL